MAAFLKMSIAYSIIATSAVATTYSSQPAAAFAEKWGNPKSRCSEKPAGYSPITRLKPLPNGGGWASRDADCQQFVCWAIKEGTGGFHFLPDRERADAEWKRIQAEGKCKEAEDPLNDDGSLSPGYSLIDYMRDNKLVPRDDDYYGYWDRGEHGPMPSAADDIQVKLPELRPGDILELDYGSWQHSMMVVEILPDGRVIVGGRNPKENRMDLCKEVREHPDICALRMLHLPSELGDGAQGQYTLNCDSTIKVWGIKHQWICCWHENLAGQAPLTSKRSAYACLSWSENRGTTWDTLITPRLTFAGCSAAVMRLESYSTLAHGSGKTIEVRGSTDGGLTWPYLLGDDTLTEVQIPWATNQKDVKISWIYHGPVQPNAYWCIDEVKFFAKPTRAHDVSVQQISWPCGVLSQGQVVTPTVLLWNHGCAGPESMQVTMTIGTGYSDSKWVKLLAHSDTILEFGPWTSSPGVYTATCHANAQTDAIRANDTASLTFRVVADTWVKMYPVYGGGGMSPGSCMAPTDSDNMYCAPGQRKLFSRYIVSQNLWKNRRSTPEDFGSGSGLAYPGTGVYLFAFRAHSSRSFYRYRTDSNNWEALAQTPDKIGAGGALTWGGGSYLYALRGNQKRSFYRYNIASNSWDTLAQTPGNIKSGGSLVWTGGDYLYALRGGDHRDFYRYQISTNTWVGLTSTPADVDDGGALAYYAQGNRIYAFFGNGAYYFYAYDIANNSWSPRCAAPGPVKNGACLTYCDYSIFGGLGMGRDENFWRYSPPVGGLDEPEPEVAPLPVVQAPPVMVSAAGGSGSFGEELLTYDPTDKLTPDYAPSDSWIAFTADDTARGCFALYRVPSTGGTPQAVSGDDRTYEDPKWSHNGSWLIAKADDGIFRFTPNGVTSVRLTEGITSAPRWSENDSWVIYERWDTTAHTHQTWRVRFDGAQDTCLSSDAGEYLEPQPVSDSEVVCVKLKDEVYQLCLVRNGEVTWLTSDYMNNAAPSLSPDRQWCTYEKLDESGYWQVYRIRVTGADESRLSDGTCNCLTPVYSPDGNYVAYSKWPVDSTGSSEFSQICQIPDTGGQEVALNDPDGVRKNPCWSNDGSYVVYEKAVASGSLDGGKTKHTQVARARSRVGYSGVEETKALPVTFALYQNRPNPFRSSTTIRYALPRPGHTDLTIYDVTGRSIRKLVQSEQKPGYHSVRWNGTDMRGRSVPAGTYFYVLKTDGKIAQRRMLLLR